MKPGQEVSLIINGYNDPEEGSEWVGVVKEDSDEKIVVQATSEGFELTGSVEIIIWKTKKF